VGAFVVVSTLFPLQLATTAPNDFGPPPVVGLVWGLAVGTVVATGGAWKDAPIEGFRLATFLRSPLAAGAWGAVFGRMTGEVPLLLAASIGTERTTVEFYKGFLRQRPPGKFAATTARFPEWLAARAMLIPPYAFTWVAFCLLAFPDASSPRDLGVARRVGLGHRGVPVAGPTASPAAAGGTGTVEPVSLLGVRRGEAEQGSSKRDRLARGVYTWPGSNPITRRVGGSGAERVER
jgi:hypothetical protein